MIFLLIPEGVRAKGTPTINVRLATLYCWILINFMLKIETIHLYSQSIQLSLFDSHLFIQVLKLCTRSYKKQWMKGL